MGGWKDDGHRGEWTRGTDGRAMEGWIGVWVGDGDLGCRTVDRPLTQRLGLCAMVTGAGTEVPEIPLNSVSPGQVS